MFSTVTKITNQRANCTCMQKAAGAFSGGMKLLRALNRHSEGFCPDCRLQRTDTARSQPRIGCLVAAPTRPRRVPETDQRFLSGYGTRGYTSIAAPKSKSANQRTRSVTVPGCSSLPVNIARCMPIQLQRSDAVGQLDLFDQPPDVFLVALVAVEQLDNLKPAMLATLSSSQMARFLPNRCHTQLVKIARCDHRRFNSDGSPEDITALDYGNIQALSVRRC